MITIHVRRGDPATLPQVLRRLYALAGGDRSRARVTSRGIEVDDALAAAYLIQPSTSEPPPPLVVPPGLAAVVGAAEARAGMAGDSSKPRKRTSRGVQP